MKEFTFFLKTNAVRKQAPDLNTAKATAKDCLERLELAKSILNTQKPKYVVENAYEAIRELIDAILYLEGYKSYSHEASVAYLLNIGFTHTKVVHVDQLRKQRNGIKYYGKDAMPEEAKHALETAQETIQELLKKKPELKQ